MKFFFDSIKSNEALSAKDKFIKTYGQSNAENADIIVPIGGDGFLLKSLHDVGVNESKESYVNRCTKSQLTRLWVRISSSSVIEFR